MGKRNLRGRITGGLDDVEKAAKILHEGLLLEDERWTLESKDISRFGDVGPLHKLNFGYTLKEDDEGRSKKGS